MFCAKNRLRKHQIFDKWDDFENRPSCKGYSLGKMVSLGQKLKFRKTCEKRFFNHIRVVLCKSAKNRLRKHQIFENAKIALAIQKFKIQKTCEKRFFNHIRVVLCKKPLEKTPNIREMRRFWKSAIVQRL